jgi:streptomycin 6-kinase
MREVRMHHYHIPARLRATCASRPAWQAWLDELPGLIERCAARWQLTLAAPFDHDDFGTAWVAPAWRADGSAVVLKLSAPIFESLDEIHALRLLAGDPTVMLLDGDDAALALVLERCTPGTPLRALPLAEQDVVIAQLLRRFWRPVAAPQRFASLAHMLAVWGDETRADRARWPDAPLVEAGLALFAELPRSSPGDVLLATDLHAGNVLAAQRAPWLVIDPNPFIGDPAYDVTQHLLNDMAPLHADPWRRIRRLAELCGLDAARVRWWLFARLAAESRDHWDDDLLALARRLA